MANKKDLRYQKTEMLIKDSFLELKKYGKVSVTSICKKAIINTSTFYDHYLDIVELEEKLQNELLNEILSNAEYIDQAFTLNENFYISLINLFNCNKKNLNLYFNSDEKLIIRKIEEELLERYLKNSHSEEEEVLIRFIIGGASHILATDCSDTKIKKTIDLVKKTMS